MPPRKPLTSMATDALDRMQQMKCCVKVHEIGQGIGLPDDATQAALEELQDRGLAEPYYWHLTLKGLNTDLSSVGRRSSRGGAGPDPTPADGKDSAA